MSDEHFTVDGTLIQAWASQRASGRRMATGGRWNELPWPGTSNKTHDPRLIRCPVYKKSYGKESKLSYLVMRWWRTATG